MTSWNSLRAGTATSDGVQASEGYEGSISTGGYESGVNRPCIRFLDYGFVILEHVLWYCIQ